jgi:hypothetical protein
MHAFRAAMKALGRAAAHRGLFAAVAVETSKDDVRDLLDQRLVITVI